MSIVYVILYNTMFIKVILFRIFKLQYQKRGQKYTT